jgi:predicted DNA-binding transcriptional regulator AlpA
MPSTFLSFADLKRAGIVTSWPHVAKLIRGEGFPPGVMLSKNRRRWAEEEIAEWCRNRPVAGPPLRGASAKNHADKVAREAAKAAADSDQQQV